MADGSFTPWARAEIVGRAHGLCQLCGAKAADQVHHRLPRRMGGTSSAAVGLPSNGLALCHWCHTRAESQREVGYEWGVLLRAGQDPASTPAWLRLPVGWGWYSLLPDGGWFLANVDAPPRPWA